MLDNCKFDVTLTTLSSTLYGGSYDVRAGSECPVEKEMLEPPAAASAAGPERDIQIDDRKKLFSDVAKLSVNSGVWSGARVCAEKPNSQPRPNPCKPGLDPPKASSPKA